MQDTHSISYNHPNKKQATINQNSFKVTFITVPNIVQT